MTRPALLTAALLLGSAALTGCDTVAELFGLNEIDVSLGSIGQIQLEPDSTVASTGSVSVTQNIPGNVSVSEIRILAESVVYSPATDHSGFSALACPLSFWILVNEVAVVEGSLVVDEDAGSVTNVLSVYAGGYERQTLCDQWSFGTCPLASGDRTSQQIRGTVDQALHGGQMSIMLIVSNPGECAGLLGIQQLRFDLSF